MTIRLNRCFDDMLNVFCRSSRSRNTGLYAILWPTDTPGFMKNELLVLRWLQDVRCSSVACSRDDWKCRSGICRTMWQCGKWGSGKPLVF